MRLQLLLFVLILLAGFSAVWTVKTWPRFFQTEQAQPQLYQPAAKSEVLGQVDTPSVFPTPFMSPTPVVSLVPSPGKETIIERLIEHVREIITKVVTEARETLVEDKSEEPLALIQASTVLTVTDQAYVLSLPTEKITINSQLQLSFKVSTQEVAPGFDHPAFQIWLDDQVTYQFLLQELNCFPVENSPCESDWQTIQFSLAPFDQPRQLTIISGNTGDELFSTSVQVKDIQLVTAVASIHKSTVAPVTDVGAVVDGNWVTLSWSAPENTSAQLDRALSYDIRYSVEPINPSISDQDWSSLSIETIILPEIFSPLAPGTTQRALVSWPIELGQPTYFAIRATDERGRLGPLDDSSILHIAPND